MDLLKNMTWGEKNLHQQMKKDGYTDEEIVKEILGIRAIPKELREKCVKAMAKSMTIVHHDEE